MTVTDWHDHLILSFELGPRHEIRFAIKSPHNSLTTVYRIGKFQNFGQVSEFFDSVALELQSDQAVTIDGFSITKQDQLMAVNEICGQ